MTIVTVNVMGGLGNQLFQIAAAYAYAKTNDGILYIPHVTDNGNRPVYWDTLLYRLKPYLNLVQVKPAPSEKLGADVCLDTDSNDGVLTNPARLTKEEIDLNNSGMEEWREEYPTMYSEISPLRQQGKHLKGYFQSSKYYPTEEIKKEIKELFLPSQTHIESIYNRYSFLLQNKERVIVLHSRQTDYITYKNIHGPLDSSYYRKAIQRMTPFVKDPIYLLCGDDVTFWNIIREDISEVFTFQHFILEDVSDIDTFALLQQFYYFIMSNSTFIWWCVWMSDAKHVISPQQWFGPDGPKKWEDIYEDKWERI